jgi:tetratricopeptide (TPR) repeat protein
MLSEDPSDAFTRYAIALEYAKIQAPEATTYFQTLLEAHPNYIPTYYQAAQWFADQNQPEKALEIYRIGIDKAREQNEVLALRELQSAYERLSFELE